MPRFELGSSEVFPLTALRFERRARGAERSCSCCDPGLTTYELAVRRGGGPQPERRSWSVSADVRPGPPGFLAT
ncbi:hypothetical protein GCM10018952_75610 [Streptosporangium vulgare]